MQNSNANPPPWRHEVADRPFVHLQRCRASLAQWRVFHAVIDCGSFASAANRLGLTQPGVSYSIAKLENQYGVRLFKLDGRKAVVTCAGLQLLEQSRRLLLAAIELEEFAVVLARMNLAGCTDQGELL
ncbi:LysR family transcriptional regulator [Pseudoduganella namucuonensis]|uniref:LysR family transcriptional regulator n=1 Tax=Pseudoduganella namucuonensis TaxID=1035707 RepID=UPI0015A65266|nr:LysR family transcriptional regulator [Pseudoduganella namucuonensis]